MKKKFYSLLTMALFGSAWLLAQPTENARNGGFEDATLGDHSASSWTLSGPAENVTYTIDTGAHSGNNCLQAHVVGRETISGVSDWTIQVVDETIILPDEFAYYRFSVWAKTDSTGQKVNFTVGLTYSPYHEVAKISGQVLSKSWTRYVIMMYNDGTFDTIRTPIHLLTNGAFYFDDLSVVETDLKSAAVDNTGDTLVVSFGWNIQNTVASLDLSSFVVHVNGVRDSVKSALYYLYSKTVKTTYILKLAVSKHIMPGDSVTLSYYSSSGNLTYVASAPSSTLSTFQDEAVVNQSGSTSVLHSLSKLSPVISPNPVSGELRLMNVNNPSGIIITNLLGQKVKTISRLSGNLIDVSGLNNGVYFLTINYADRTSTTLKFVKQ